MRSFLPIFCLLLTLSAFCSSSSADSSPDKMQHDSSIHVPNQPRPQVLPQIRAKRAAAHGESGFNVQALIELLLCFFLPPAAVALHGGSGFKLHILLNVLLCILGWVPGILHAVWYCFISGR